MGALYEQADQGLVALHAYASDNRLSRAGHREGECPQAEALFQQYVSLPIHPRLTAEAISYLIDSIRSLA